MYEEQSLILVKFKKIKLFSISQIVKFQYETIWNNTIMVIHIKFKSNNSLINFLLRKFYLNSNTYKQK